MDTDISPFGDRVREIYGTKPSQMAEASSTSAIWLGTNAALLSNHEIKYPRKKDHPNHSIKSKEQLFHDAAIKGKTAPHEEQSFAKDPDPSHRIDARPTFRFH